jgi:ribosome-associated translation inhibitor RaiA
MDLDVQVSARGDVGPKMTAYARTKVAQTARFVRDPILFARVKLLVEPDPARERPALAAAELDVDGLMVRAHALGQSLQGAIDLLQDRLRDELEHLSDRRQELRKRGPMPREPHEWRRGYASTSRPAFFDRPAEQREVIRRKTYTLLPLAAEDAIDEMERMGYDFHLFVCRDTNVPCVVSRRVDGRYDIISTGTMPPPIDEWLVPDPVPAPTVSEGEARARLEATGAPFVLFNNAASGVAAVMYHRYDGHYGVIEADGATLPMGGGSVGAASVPQR